MRLYVGASDLFILDTVQNRIADILKNAFFEYYRFNPSPAEVQSWRNSLRALAQVFQYGNLSDHGVILEYQLPLTSKRLDCIICGRDASDRDNAVIIELKQWERCEPALGDYSVTTWLGGSKREVLHPSVQVGQYQSYLEDTHTAFYEDAPVALGACSYLHNYNVTEDDELVALKFAEPIKKFPLFAASQVDDLTRYLKEKVARGAGLDVLARIESSQYRPSKKLMHHVASVIRGKSEYTLLDEQLVVYDQILAAAKQQQQQKKKVIIVKGGPGTGKSVIAINVMADLLLAGFNAQYATGSRAFTETLRKVIGSRGAVQFKYYSSYRDAQPNEIDVLIGDEAHRIGATSNSRFTPKEKRTDTPQLEELLRAARVCVFFIDDAQVIRPNEKGSSEYIKELAAQFDADIREYELEAQFRCAGSDAFVNWINNTLGIRRTANVIWSKEKNFEFKIFDSPHKLESAILDKFKAGNTARLAAGFCWKWSEPNPDGTLKNDVVIGSFERPWDAKPGARGLSKDIPPAALWAHDPRGIGQIGCVYTAQGFEFDYIGVIFGPDLRYDFDQQTWIGDRSASADTMVKRAKDRFTEYVKNTYRVLLSRGIKGCYVYFMDKDTERFFKSRLE